jgi:hypothetical protein
MTSIQANLRNKLALVLALGSAISMASDHNHDHSPEKHVHGEGMINVVINETWKTAEIEWHLPAMDILGFERAAKNPAEQSKIDSTLKQLAREIPLSLNLNSNLNCKTTLEKDSPDFDVEGEHAEIQVEIDIVCEKSLKDSELEFKFTKSLEKFKTFELQLIAPQVQLAKTFKKPGGKIIIK